MLYVVATPIGNLDDITLRALKTLENADLIAAEDTRHTLCLLEHFGLKKPLVSYFEHNKFTRGPEILDKLRKGQNVALVSDAGMPGICDPGHDLIKSCIDEGIGVTVVPGPSACVSALVLSGLPTDKFVFEGFVPTDNKSRRQFFALLLSETRTAVCYEAPHRILKTLTELEKCFEEALTPDRRISVLRELTKTHEEVVRGTAAEIKTHFEENAPRGEFVICIEGAAESGTVADRSGSALGAPAAYTDDDIRTCYSSLTDGGMLPKDAIKALKEKYGISRNDAYRIVNRKEDCVE